jgi:hypothetical protein
VHVPRSAVVPRADLGADRNSGLAARLVVPPGYVSVDRSRTSCGFSAGFGRNFYVSVGTHDTLRAEKERDLDPRDDVGGDDSVGDISYADDVPVFGDHTGERLDYYCYCDGEELDERIV